MAERRFPIQFGGDIESIPWAMIATHEQQARANHDQSLARLAERGGLSPDEAVAVLEDRHWQRMDPPYKGYPPKLPVSTEALRKLVAAWGTPVSNGTKPAADPDRT